MIVGDPYWMEREDPAGTKPGELYVDLDKQPRIPFGFGLPPAPTKKKAKKKRKKARG